MKKTYDYDAIIIGAGIGGLTCGCYLAKAGLKTLIVEKNHYPGGYCCSFTRQGYRFDACVHFLSTLRKNSKFYTILNNLGLFKEIKIIRHDPSDIIITPDFKIKICNDINKTIIEFQNCFPGEKNQIEKFFNDVISTPTMSLTIYKNRTLQNLLDSYFSDNYLKTILSVLILGLAGSSASQISALVACLIYREFVLLDGGYYPLGGMQKFADAFVKTFTKFGGKILMSNKVEKIIVQNNKAQGVILENNKPVYSRYVISACDARQTFFELIDSDNINRDFSKVIESLIPSYSAFMVYLGMDSDFNCSPDLKSNMWIINSRDMSEIHSKMLSCDNIHFAITSPSMKEQVAQKTNKASICLTTNVPFINAEYWQKESIRKEFESRLVGAATKILPELPNHIYLKFNATPITLYKWTSNYQGAAYGWEGRISQFCNPDISEKTIIENMYLTGHWNNMGSGITSVANSGYSTANLVLSKEKRL